VEDRQQVETGQLICRAGQPSGPQLAHIVQGCHRARAQVDEALGVVGQHSPGVGQYASAARAIEQRPANLVFELFDRLADRGLGAVEGFRGGGKAAFPDHGEKRF
jgi:hypothetical protein